MRTPWVIASAVSFGLLAHSASAQSPAEFYKGKQISLIVSAGEGGGYSSYAHAFAPFLAAHIPGNPTVVVQNMPGGGGIRAMNHLYSTAPKDGTTIGLVHSSVPFAPLYGIKAATFDPRKMNWIGSLATESGMCVSWMQSGVTTWKDLHTKEFIVGGTGAGSQMETLPTMINKLFGTNIKIISGYKGGNNVFLAMERGEVHGRCGGLVSSINSTRPTWFPEKKVAVPIIIGLERSKRFPDTPALGEFVKDERTRKLLELILSPQDMDRPIVAPPGVPEDRLQILGKAFHEAMVDPGFVEEARKQRLEIEEVSGPKVAGVIARAYSTPAEIVRQADDIMNLSGKKAKK